MGRRRPFFLLGALPFAATFALLWWVPGGTQTAKFLYYSTVSVALSLSMTIVAVPYFALLPEMARDYDERSSLNTFRSAAAVVGTLAAVGLQPLAHGLGGGEHGYLRAGTLLACWLAIPWLIVFRSSSEDPPRAKPTDRLLTSLRALAQHRAYRTLAGLYVAGRVAIDITSAVLLFYFAQWLGRSEDFAPALLMLLGSVILSLPLWLLAARHLDKRMIFVIGVLIWIVGVVGLAFAQPDWPRWSVFAISGWIGIGYAVVDLMPWAMLGDVVDEDELCHGKRREGIYAGVFTFLRKLGGATGVALVGFGLSAIGYVPGSPQSPSTLLALRVLATALPALFLALALVLAWRHPLTRSVHGRIRRDLEARAL